MSQDKELEIQLQFLEEAQEYLDTIESVLLGLAGRHIDSQQMDAVLRAAHSVKGGAGMMGFQSLSQLAHRLEDSFKVMKAQRNSLEVDAELESLLLGAVDRLRHVLECNRQRTDVDLEWLSTVGQPVFDRLHDRLGDPVADDANTMLGPEEGTNVAALLFETEVEGCLNRLESVLADPQAPCLEEEVSIMAQELGGLGEMLQLPAFTQLCESIVQHLSQAPERVKEIAQSALDAWRRSQALVLVGQVNSLPAAIAWASPTAAPVMLGNPTGSLEPRVSETYASPTSIFEFEWEEAAQYQEIAEVSQHANEPKAVEAALLNDIGEVFAAEFDIGVGAPGESETYALAQTPISTQTPLTIDAPLGSNKQLESTEEQAERLYADFGVCADQAIATNGTYADEVLEERVDRAAPEPAATNTFGRSEVRSGDFKWQEEKPLSAASAKPTESQENSVRIPVRQLDRINDLFGELTIERNGLSLALGRLRNLIETLSRRVSTLEQSNIRLRTAYDTVATQASVLVSPSFGSPALARQTPSQTAPTAVPNLVTLNAQSSLSDAPHLRSDNAYGHHTGSLASFGDSTLSYNSRFDALEMDRYSDIHLLSMEVMETIVQIQEVTSDIGLSLEDTEQTTRELNQTAKQLQTNLTRLRMRPLSDLVGRFSRALRDLSLQYGKQVELKVYGKGTLIDRSILEALSDPLMHLVRNAFDHGIEDPRARTEKGKPPKGVIEIKAAHRGNQTIITVSDDGNGINLNKIRARAEAMGLDAELLAAASEDELLSLIFEPGFSTADQVTDLSGRGVGMDVVRNNLKLIRGDIRVDTQASIGTTFTLTVPFTLSVARVLLVESNGMLLAFPTDVIEEMILLRHEQVLTTAGSEVLNWEGSMVPLTRLSEWLTFYCPRRVQTPEGVPSISEPTVLMISLGDQLVGLAVERCWGEREVAIRQVEGTYVMPPGFASCTILGDGRVVPLVDAASLLRWIASEGRVSSRDSERLRVWSDSDLYIAPHAPEGLRVWDAGGGVSDVIASPQTAQTPDRAGGRGAYVRSEEALSSPTRPPHTDSTPERDLYIAPHALTPTYKASEPDRLPLTRPAQTPNHPPVPAIPTTQKDTILVVDDSINVRRFLALALEKAGYLVEQAKDGQDAVEKLLGGLGVSAVICDIEMPRLDGYGFLARIKSDPAFSDLPIAMLTSRTGDKHRQLAMTLGAAAYFSKPYNERELLRTMRQLITESRSRKPIPSGIL